MESKWKETILGEIIKTNISSYSNKDSWEYVNYLDTGNITENNIDNIQKLIVGFDKIPSRAKRKVENGDIIYSTVRPNQLHYGIIKNKIDNLLVSTGFTTIRTINTLADNNFIFWYLTQAKITKHLQSIGENSTTTYPSIKPSDIEKLQINLPPLSEQKAIAQILSSLDNKIELNRQMNQTLEQMAQAMFKSWFVDFDPFQEEEFINSEIGNIPSSFEVKTIGDYISHQKGFAFKSKWYQETGQIVVRVSDTTENSINKNSCNKIADEIANDYRKYELNTNDIIIATVGSWPPNYSSVVGKVVRVPETVKGGLLNQNAVKLEMIINGNKHQALLYFILKEKRFLDYIVSRAQGSANQASIKLTDIFRYPIPMIENDKLFEISQYLEDCIAKQNKALNEIETLTKLRDSLLPKLISGKLRVPEELIEKE